MLLGASRVAIDTATSPAHAKRLAVFAYCRKGNFDAIERVRKTYYFTRHVVDWYTSLPEYRKSFNPATFFDNVGDYGILDGIALIGWPNADKFVWLSTFVDAFLRLHEEFVLSLEESLEILYPVALMTEPYKYWCVLHDWIRHGNLPRDDCLLVAFAKACQLRFGGFCSGPFPRMQTSSGSPLCHDKVALSLRNLRSVVLKYNMIDSVSQETYRQLVKEVSKGVHRAGPLTAQHLCQVLILTGILNKPGLGVHSVVADKSGTAEKIQSLTGCQGKEEIDSVLRSVSSSLGCSTSRGENCCCESTRTTPAYDFYLLGQSIYSVIYEPSSGHWQTMRYFGDGRSTHVVPFVHKCATAKKNHRPRSQWLWWLSGSHIPAGRVFTTAGSDNQTPVSKVFSKHVFVNSVEAADYRKLFFSGGDTHATEKLVQARFRSLLAQGGGKCSPTLKMPPAQLAPTPGNNSLALWSELCKNVADTYHPTMASDPSQFDVMSSSEVAKVYSPDLLFPSIPLPPSHDSDVIVVLPPGMLAGTSHHARHNRASSSVKGHESVSVTNKKKRKAIHHAGLSMFSYASKPPRGIPKNMVAAASLRAAIGNWKNLDLLVAASTCCGAEEKHGGPLKSKDLQCNALRHPRTRVLGFYATLLDYDFGQDDCLMYIGTGHLGWSEDSKLGTRRLLFGSKQQAIDHLLLCIVLSDGNGHKWRADWTSRRVFCGQDSQTASVIHVGKNHAKGRDNSQPLFSLVACRRNGATIVYAAFVSDFSIGPDNALFFPFTSYL